jgi:hypothetical protein
MYKKTSDTWIDPGRLPFASLQMSVAEMGGILYIVGQTSYLVAQFDPVNLLFSVVQLNLTAGMAKAIFPSSNGLLTIQGRNHHQTSG